MIKFKESGNLCIIEWGDMIEEIIESEFNKFVISNEGQSRIIEKIK